MKGNCRTLLRQYCLESTIIGLKYFYLYPDPISRCFWLINMVAVLTLSFILSFLLYNRFVEMPTRITIENQNEPLESLPYPSIFLCSPNQFTASFMRHFNRTLVNGNLTLDLERVLPNLLGFYELIFDIDANDLDHLQSLLDLNRYTVTEVMAAIPQSCEKFLKLCFFEGVKYPNCETLFAPLLTAHGLCCAFNNIYRFKDKRNIRDPFFEVRNVKRGGRGQGLIVVTDYNPEDALDATILFAGAAKVMYTDYTEFPADDESSLVESNVESHHIVRATYSYCSDDVKALPYWSRECYLEDEHNLPFFSGYHNSDCDLTCYARAVQDNCNCMLFFMPRLRSAFVCNLTSIPCIVELKGRMGDWLTKCDCPRDCESRRYKVDLSIGNLDAMPYMIYNPFKELKFNKSTSIMNFYFANSVFVKQKEETIMSIVTFISNLGGVFGLCMGCSYISVLEICFYIYLAIRNHCRKFQRSRVKNVDYYQ